jgi:hypothetical protein
MNDPLHEEVAANMYKRNIACLNARAVKTLDDLAAADVVHTVRLLVQLASRLRFLTITSP